MRLDSSCAKSIAAQDIRTALQAQRELNHLLSLYDGTGQYDRFGESPDDGLHFPRNLTFPPFLPSDLPLRHFRHHRHPLRRPHPANPWHPHSQATELVALADFAVQTRDANRRNSHTLIPQVAVRQSLLYA